MPLQPVAKFETSSSFHPLVKWGPDGHTLAFNSYKDVWMKRWAYGDLLIGSKGQGLTRLEGHTDYVTSLTWSPDGALLASGSRDSAVRVWDARTQRCVSILRGHSELVLAVAFSPDGSLLASAGSDRNVRLWDLAAEAPAASLVDPKKNCYTTGLAWSPDGRLLAAARWPENVVRVWDVAGRKLLSSLPCKLPLGEPVGLGFSPDGQLLAAPCGEAVRVWEVESLDVAASLKGHYAQVRWAAFSPDGRWLASASADGTGRVWGAARGASDAAAAD